MLQRLLDYWTRPIMATRRAGGHGPQRSSIYPPARRQSDSLLQTLLSWMPGESDAWRAIGERCQARGTRKLPGVRAEFEAMLEDVHSDDVQGLLTRIQHSRSLRDLWHMRAAVYNVVARAHSQAVAEQRIAHLNRHFSIHAHQPGQILSAGKTWH